MGLTRSDNCNDCGECLYTALDDGGDEVQVRVISTQVKRNVVIDWVKSLAVLLQRPPTTTTQTCRSTLKL